MKVGQGRPIADGDAQTAGEGATPTMRGEGVALERLNEAKPTLGHTDAHGVELGGAGRFVPTSDGTAGAAQLRARAGSRPITTEVPFGAHSFSVDPKTLRFLDAAPSLGVPASVMPLLSEDLRPAENERRLLAEAKAAYAPAAFQKIAEALEVAREAHEGQTQSRKNDPHGLSHIPYLNHPVQIARMAVDLGMSAEAVQAALLHDVVEDTGVTLADLSSRFSPEVTELVAHLTKLPTETRAEYLARVSALSGDASAIKILDRVHNLLRGFTTRDAAYLARYLEESQKIYAPKVERTPNPALRARFELMITELTRYAEALRA